MKNFLFICVLLICFACNDDSKKQTVELSRGQCQFGLTSKDGCDLAVRLDGKSYFVDGVDINDFGDAHDEKTGFCETVRKAEVTGELNGDRFVVSSVKMLDE